MSSSSDSEEFYDAEDVTPNRGNKKSKEKEEIVISDAGAPEIFSTSSKSTLEDPKDPNENLGQQLSSSDHFLVPAAPVSDNVPEVEQKVQENERRRQRIRELRRKIQAEDEDGAGVGGNPSPPDSQTSSIEGVYPSTRTTHPFRIIEHDAISLQSVTSLGRVGRILAGSEAAAAAGRREEAEGRSRRPEE
ncbi:hypothetical protein J437_LFUL011186, partial [Ladona fulva]